MTQPGALLYALAATGLLAVIPVPAQAQRRLSPWFIYQGKDSLASLKPRADLISSVSVAGGPPREFVDQCHKLGLEVYALVGGHEGKAFSTPEGRRRLIDEYLQSCEEKGYDGLDLDFENIENEYRDSYSTFLRETATALHAAGKKLSTCVSYIMSTWRSREGPQPGLGGINWYDPAVIGNTCDLVRVMCYDMYSTSGGAVGPVSTRPWARDAMRFWLKYVPREKLVMGLPAYSRDFTLAPGGQTESPYAPAPQVPKGTVLQRIWLPYEEIKQYRYADAEGRLHLFYASDTASTQAHLRTAAELGLKTIGFWHYGAVTAEMWRAVRQWVGEGE